MTGEWNQLVGWYEGTAQMRGWEFLTPMIGLIKWVSDQEWARSLYPHTSLVSLCVAIHDGYRPELPCFSVTYAKGQFKYELWKRVGETWQQEVCEASLAPATFERFTRLLFCISKPGAQIQLNARCLTPTVRSLAQAIYDNRNSGQLPILADALEEAGYSQEDVLRHLRDVGEHVRDCWALALVLGNE